jgi:large subunit ribosomal protein L22
VLKVLKSAIANATKNFGVDPDKLSIKTVKIEQGPTLKYAKRYIPRAMGRASQIHKRTCHITVVVTDNK